MSEQPPDRTDAHEPADALEAGLAEAFGPDSGPPLPADGSVLRALGLDAPRVQLPEPEGGVAELVVRPHSEQVPQGPGERYELHGEIARGGMGAVLKGRDVELGRDVAVKVLLESHAGRTELLQRFVEEAQIAGQLQHPGVAPVYGMGRLADRRPYFAMKLVKGQTLARLLAGRKGPDEERSRFLGIFLQACQAVAYAHSRGVIHRDLKPSNVMVGAFGEVLVMDWGLAKVLTKGGVADERKARQADEELTAIRTKRSDASGAAGNGGTQTQAGTVLGTPAYMAPEQALGEVDRLDERADVFALGAILCQVLTGQPPYAGGDHNQLLRRAARSDLADAFALLDRCGADAELVELTKRCLTAEPADRPRDAGAVAEQLSAHLQAVEQRLRQAELGRAQAEVRAKEERKRRRVQLALAGALALLLALAASGALYLQSQHELRQRERAERARQAEVAVEAALEKADQLRAQARCAEASSLLEQARAQLGDGAAQELRERLERAQADVALVGELDAIRLKKATLVEGKFDYTEADREYAEAFRKHGLGGPGQGPAAVAARVGNSAVKGPLLAALDDWGLATTTDRQRQNWLLEVARRADPHPWRDRLRDPAVWDDRKKFQALVAGAKAEELSPQMVVALGMVLEAEQAVPLLRAVQQRHPDDFWVNFILGTLLRQQKQEEAIGYLRVAVALRPTAGAAHNNLGNALLDKGKIDEAIACFRKAIELGPRYAHAHTNLGNALETKGQVDEAIACYRAAIEIDPRDAGAHTNLGTALKAKGQVDDAIACHRKAIGIDPRLAASHNNLGLALKAKGQVDQAIASYRKAIEINPRYALAHYNLGLALEVKGQVDQAIASYRKALQIDPRLASAHTNLGNVLHDKGKVDQAIACFRKAIDIDPRDAHAHAALGQALLEKGRFAEARDASARALQLLPKQHPLRAVASQQLQSCERLRKLEERLPGLLRGGDRPGSAQDCLDLALMCRQHKQLPAAAARFYAEAFARQPGLAEDLAQQHRHHAACSAALAAARRGKDTATLRPTDRLALRRQALTWLRADLRARQEQLKSWWPGEADRARAALAHWQKDPDLAGLRDAKALEALPAEERRACVRLWADVALLLRKVGGPAPR
jgi:serine/threonine-protein kinase